MITNHFSEHRDLTFINQESWSFACYNIYKNNCETRQEGFVIIHSNNELLTKIWIDHDTCDNSGRREFIHSAMQLEMQLFIQKWSLGRISKIPSLQQKNMFNHYDVSLGRIGDLTFPPASLFTTLNLIHMSKLVLFIALW